MRKPRKPLDLTYMDAVPSWTSPAQRSDIQERADAAKLAGDVVESNALLASRLLALTVEDVRIQANRVQGECRDLMALPRSQVALDLAERLRKRAVELIEAIDRLPTALALMNEGQRRVDRKGARN